MRMQSGTSIIIVTYNSAATISECLLSVAGTLGPDDEVVVIDNNSCDDTVQLLQQIAASSDGNIRILPQEQNHGFSRGCNIGIEATRKEFVILLNPDTEVFGDWISRLTAHFSYFEKTGAVGPLSNYCLATQNIVTYVHNYEEFDWTADRLFAVLHQTFSKRSVPVKLLIGFCMALRRELIDRWGGLDEDIFLGNDDLELSWRLREKGCLLRVALDVFINHTGQMSFATIPDVKGRRLIDESSNVLFRKMQAYYAPDKIPHPRIYFGIDWWRPSAIANLPAEQVFETEHESYDVEQVVATVRSLVKQQRIVDATRLLEACLKIHVDRYQLWVILGTIYFKMKNFPKAEFALRNAWALQLNAGRVEEMLIKTLRALGKEEEIDTLLGVTQEA